MVASRLNFCKLDSAYNWLQLWWHILRGNWRVSTSVGVVDDGIERLIEPLPEHHSWRRPDAHTCHNVCLVPKSLPTLFSSKFYALFPENFFSLTIPWHFSDFTEMPNISSTSAKFPGISKFSRKLVTSNWIDQWIRKAIYRVQQVAFNILLIMQS